MNAPTLIVGLGGKGSDVALRVSRMVTEEQRQRIAFVVFDTDVNELRQIKAKNPFVHTVQTSTKLSVGEYLDIDTHARDTWFPVNAILNSKTLTEGAGQVRAVSRMAFETALRAGKMEELHQAIQSLYKLEGEEYQQALRVIIVSSLAGGTGSGLILPVALYIKNFLATRFRQSANITRGFFLLPEVFYSVIPSQVERNNLKSNAYATLREIDAFMMKGDATLPDRFKKTVRMEFPSVSSGDYEEYNVRPFDFCFLFDAQNSDGMKLNSFSQYLDHAANCIYAQSIGPMNKRSNSSEDNTIRKLVSERGRNRYAGAGTSMLIYPTTDVKRYMSLTWAKECVSDVWLMFDRTFRDLVKRNAEMRRKGHHVADIKEATNYIESVEASASAKDPFAMAIVDSCTLYDENGVAVRGYSWDEYMEALRRKVANEGNTSSSMELDNQRGAAQAAVDNIQPGSNQEAWDLYEDAYRAIQAYMGSCLKKCADSARTIGYSIFSADGDNVSARKEKHQLETYMRNSATGEFIHPCAVRYFLYKVEDNMSKQYQDIKRRVAKEEEYFDKFEETYFDVADTSEKEGVSDLSKTKKVTLIDKISRRYSADQEDLLTAYDEYVATIDAYRVDAVYQAVLEEGLNYVRNISASFESFFKSFDSKVTGIEKEARMIQNKYAHLKGTAARYVCCSKDCLEAMTQRMPYTGGTIEIDGSLAEKIYERVRSHAMLSVKSNSDDYFSSIFDHDIIDYFGEKLLQSYGPEVDMDIITAIEKELEYEKNIVDSATVEHYVKSVIDAAKVLAVPFIEKPIGEEKEPIYSCAFNDELSPGDDSPRAQLISAELLDFGGEPDSDIPKNMILFYKGFYGLRANELSKFAPPKEGETHERSGGEYYKAYYELISKIHPIPSKSKVITPHIDRWWHNPTMMPDLDESNQEKQLQRIHSAFFWAFMDRIVDLHNRGANSKAYRIVEPLVDEEDMELTVSNGTPCDQLYEVLDALAIYPELVDKILVHIDDALQKDVEAGMGAWDNDIIDRFETFTINTLNDEHSSHIRSIFEIPFLLKRSATSDLYSEAEGISIMQAIVQESSRIMRRFSSEEDYPSNLAKLYREQYDLLVKNLEQENKNGKNYFYDYLFARVSDCLANALKETGMNEDAKAIKKRAEELARTTTK
ncbi:MAG: tubulin-like doman-containing protein [Lachnospiraceae bacterium]|nr:tubulin-like doman-containing protein [Lachnospiraceae bacterium]